jgi:DNA-binding protein HU-beta
MADKMTQSALIKEIAEKLEVSSKVAKSFLTLFSDIAVRETKKVGEFTLPGIGKLVRQERKARLGRNPATGETIKIAAKKVVKFRVAKAVKDAIVPAKPAKKEAAPAAPAKAAKAVKAPAKKAPAKKA